MLKLATIITQLRTYCPSLDNRVAGASDFKPIPDATNMPVPSAYVMPLDDNPDENRSKGGGYDQVIRDGFAVVLVLSNVADARGQAAKDCVFAMRSEIWKALLGWSPTDDYDGIVYTGGHLLMMDRARLYYQLEFSALTEITYCDTWLSVRDTALPAIQGVDINLDAISPMADKNIKYPGPDGRIENVVTIDLPST